MDYSKQIKRTKLNTRKTFIKKFCVFFCLLKNNSIRALANIKVLMKKNKEVDTLA